MLRYIFFIFFLTGLGCSCKNQKILETRVSLWRLDKIPYGTKYAYENLPFIFPHAIIRTSDYFPLLSQSGNGGDSIRALIILAPRFEPGPEEMNSIIRFAAAGNQVFISALVFEDTVLNMLHLKKVENLFPFEDSTGVSLLDMKTKEWRKYTYPGYSYGSYFEAIDTGHTIVLGKDMNGSPDFIRISYARGGAIFVHLNPLSFSNFFLLHKRNQTYYDLAFSYMPVKTAVVEWSDYYRYAGKAENFSALDFILSQRALRWAFWLTLLLFLVMFLAESKRKQRPIAEIPALRNASQDFVKTVSRLYFQQKNNQNLAAKMIAAFLENIRSSYNLSTSMLNDEFARKLSFRTGRPVNEIMLMIQSIHKARLNADLSDRDLMDLHQQFSQFNKQAP
jgi:hypothetical protein